MILLIWHFLNWFVKDKATNLYNNFDRRLPSRMAQMISDPPYIPGTKWKFLHFYRGSSGNFDSKNLQIHLFTGGQMEILTFLPGVKWKF